MNLHTIPSLMGCNGPAREKGGAEMLELYAVVITIVAIV